MPIRIVPKKKPNRVYMTDDNSGVIYSDKKGNVISKEQAMKGFDDADAAERREERRSSQYKKMKRGGGVDMGDPKKPVAIPTGKDSEVMIHNMMPSTSGERPIAAPRRKGKDRIEKLKADLRNKPMKKMKTGGLTGGQKKLDVNNDGKISGEDFKILKGKNNKMKGGGIAIKGTNFKGVF